MAQAAGLGRLVVFSALGQPLRAEIEVTATRQELADMKAQLASPETFRQAGLDYATALLGVRFEIDRRPNGQVVIQLSSERPINDPFLDMLLELSWATGRLVREYTFLLDPPPWAASTTAGTLVQENTFLPDLPEYADTTLVPASSPSAVAGTPARPQAPSVIDDEVRARAIAQVQFQPPQTAGQRPTAAPVGEKREVKRGDTLYRIATEMKPEGVSLDQMLVSLLRANPGAFDGKNMNRLRAGAILSMPSESALESISAGEARKIVMAQSSDWNAYRNRLAGLAARSVSKEDAARQESDGKITAKVADKTEPTAPKDLLKVSGADPADPASEESGGAATPKVSDEDLIARDKALREANERIALLEKTVADQKKLLELQNQSLAELQEQVPAETTSTPQSPTQAASPEKTPLPPPEEPGFIERWIDDVGMLAGGGGVVLALIAACLFWRRRRAMPAEPEPVDIQDSEMAAEVADSSVFKNAAGGQSVDTSSQMQVQTDFSQVGPGSIDTDEVDPVAEADVYMAYGRDAQAEEILREARQKDPKRVAITLKLLEVHSRRKDARQFEVLATELYGETGGAGPDWDKAAAMGRMLDLGNPIFHGGAVKAGPENRGGNVAPPEVPAATQEPEAPVMPGQAAPPRPADIRLPEESALRVPEAAPAKGETADLDFDIGTKVAPLAEVLDPQEDGMQMSRIDFDPGDVSLTPPDFVKSDGEETTVPPATGGDGGDSSEKAPAQDLGDDAVEFDVSLTESTLLGRPPEPPPFDMGSIDLDLDSPDLEIPEIEVPPPLDDAAKAPPQQGGEEHAPRESQVTTAIHPNFASQHMETVVVPPAPSQDEEARNADFAREQVETPVPVSPPEAGTDFGFANPQEDTVINPSFADPRQDPAPELDVDTSEEAATKLDLAKAYEEMGDIEGALELLQEVLEEGNASQREAAQVMLARVGG